MTIARSHLGLRNLARARARRSWPRTAHFLPLHSLISFLPHDPSPSPEHVPAMRIAIRERDSKYGASRRAAFREGARFAFQGQGVEIDGLISRARLYSLNTA